MSECACLWCIYKQWALFGAKICSGIFPRTLSVWRSESVSRGKLNFEEQIMYKDKYLTVFSRQMEAIVLIILKYFSNTRSFKIGEYHSEISAGEYSVA